LIIVWRKVNHEAYNYFVVGLCLTFISPLYSQETQTIELPAKENFHLFLLAGQSNMAGRGTVFDEDRIINPRVLALSKEGEWVPAVDPIHYDKSVAGVGLGKSFALALIDHDPNITVGLIPAACGGSPISTWEPGGYHAQTKSHPYDDAIARTNRALQNGTLKGILWHQGESDCNETLAPLYHDKLTSLINRFRTEFKIDDLPFITGQLGQFPQSPWNEFKLMVNDAHMMAAKEMNNVRFVISDGLTCNPDNIHFDAPSQRTFGKRYAGVYLEMIK
jgi:hypothetical protein